MELDFSQFAIAGVSIVGFTLGAVQLLKDWLGWEGSKVTVLSAVLGALVMGLFQVIQFLPSDVVPIVEAVFIALTFGLVSSGYFKLANSISSKSG